MLRAMLFMVTVLSCGSTAMAGLRDECLGLFGIAVDDIGILTCTAAIRENDRDGELYAARGRFYSFWRNYDHAIADFIKAGELGAKTEKLDDMLGAAYLEKGELDRAIALFDKSIQNTPDGSYAFVKRADAYRRKGDLTRALLDINKSIEHISAEISARRKADPNDLVLMDLDSNPYYYRGLIHSSLDQYDRAIADFTESISRGENGAWQIALILSHRAETHLKMGASAQALADSDKAVELDATNASHLELRARVREAMGQKTEALKDFRRALSLDPKHKRSLEGLTRLGVSP